MLLPHTQRHTRQKQIATVYKEAYSTIKRNVFYSVNE